MAILMDDGRVLPDVAYLTSAQLGRPFPVKWVHVPERTARRPRSASSSPMAR